MKKVIFLGSKDAGEKNRVQLLAQRVASDAVAVRTVYFEDLLFTINGEHQSVIDTVSRQDIADAELVLAVNWYRNGRLSLYRDVAFATALYLEARGVALWNQEMLHQRSTTKLSAMMQLALAGLPVPATWFSLDGAVLTAAADGYPLICKAVAASRGRHNYLIESAAELQQRLAGEAPNSFMLQAFIPNDSDLRVVCFGGEPHLVIRRSRQDHSSHLNNVSQGAKAKLLPAEALGPELQGQCRQICRLMGREMAGIDLLLPDGGLSQGVFLEVNAVPQLTSGAFVDEKLAALKSAIEKVGTV